MDQGSISKAISQSSDLDEESAQLLWDRFFERLCEFASKKIYKRHQSLLDAEDVAGSAMFALIDGLKNGRFNKVADRDQFWQLAVVIAARKASNKAKYFDRQKRGGKKTFGESRLKEQGLNNLAEYVQNSENPAKLVEFQITCRELLQALPDENYREIALMRMSGFNNQEIGNKLGCSTRTVDRKLNAIRAVWEKVANSEPE